MSRIERYEKFPQILPFNVKHMGIVRIIWKNLQKILGSIVRYLQDNEETLTTTFSSLSLQEMTTMVSN